MRVFLSPVGGGAFGNSSDAVSAPTLLPAEISRSVEPVSPAQKQSTTRVQTLAATFVCGSNTRPAPLQVANALHRALRLVRGSPLDEALVHFQQLPPESHPYRQLERAALRRKNKRIQ